MHPDHSKYFSKVSCVVFFLNVSPVLLLLNSREDYCLSVIPEFYDRFDAPQPDAGHPAKIFIQIKVLDLDEINEETMDFRLHFFLRSVWQDPRFFPNASSYLHEGCAQYIWIPDLLFKETKTIDDYGSHNSRLMVQNGYTYLSQRYSFKVACHMNFVYYPFDTQHCIFSITLMATDDCSAVLKWSSHSENPYKRTMLPIVLPEDIDPLQFRIAPPTAHSEVRANSVSSQNFTHLLANFTLIRRLTATVVNYYMPSALLVAISWVTFWLEQDAAPERVTLIMTALLTICTQGNQYKSELPPVNYITALDIWFFVCVSMLFATLLEFAFSYNSFRKEKRKRLSNLGPTAISCSSLKAKLNETSEKKDDKDSAESNVSPTLVQDEVVPLVPTARLDSACKFLFPSFFLTFTVIYWSYYYPFYLMGNQLIHSQVSI